MPRHRSYEVDIVAEKAMRVFWSKGYMNTSARQLERAMGINPFSMYASFGNKDGVLVAAMDRYIDRMRSEVLDPLMQGPTDLKSLRKFFHGFLAFTKERNRYKGCLLINTANELGSTMPRNVKQRIVRFSAEILAAFTTVLVHNEPKAKLVARKANYLFISLQGIALTAKAMGQDEVGDHVDMLFDTLATN